MALYTEMICDRCGNIIKDRHKREYQYTTVKLNVYIVNDLHKTESVDVCDECAKEIYNCIKRKRFY